MLSSHQELVGYLWISGHIISILCTTHFFLSFIPILFFFRELHWRKVMVGKLLQPSPGAHVHVKHFCHGKKSECSCEPPAGQSSKWLCLFLSLKDNFSLPGCSTVFSHRKDDQTMHAKGYSASYSFYCHKLMLYQTRKYWNQTEHTANHFVLIAQHFVSLKDHQILLLKIHLSLIFLFWLGTRVPSTFLPWHALTPIILPFSREEVQCCQPTQTWVRSCYCSSVLFILQGGKGKR